MYSGLQYNTIVYEGFLEDAETPTGLGPSSNVRNINDSIGRLGCGDYNFFLTARCASTGVLCTLDTPLIAGKFDRRLDDVSEAEIVLQFGGDATYTCCECLAESEPWCHELHIWRNGDEVWVGPVISIEYTRNTVTIRANDSLEWLGVRVPPADLDFTAGTTDLTDQAIILLQVAYAEDGPEYTCELDNIFSEPTGYTWGLFFEGYNQTALEILRDISDTGLDFTTLGRTIVLVGDANPLTPLIVLNDSHIIGDIKITKDGESQGNRYYVHFEGDGGIPAVSAPVDEFCYGPIERIRDGDGLNSGIDAASVADIYTEASYIAPRTIEIPAGSKLAPETPWEFNEMVCGARVDVAVTTLCLELTQSFRLTNVEVTLDPDDGESVGITLTPINSTTVE